MINFSTISNIFSSYLKENSDTNYSDDIENLIFLSIKTNKILWDLEDSARMSDLGAEHVAEAKKNIDINNQIRNDLMRQIDLAIVKKLNIEPGTRDQFYSESPGMIIDRLSILFIKFSAIEKLLNVIQEDDLKEDYKQKKQIISRQIKKLGQFLDGYFSKLLSKEVYFEIQQPVKIYNDERIQKYIKNTRFF